ncbi:YihY/virulence factor BrkB family protein [Rhodobacterales bacterium]|nr:YihY/virulence factor BrkB family protein [Rhodobacterales bacterium]
MQKTVSPRQARRGATATSAGKIPFRGWIDVLIRTWQQTGKDNVFLISAGVAFYFLLALVPALTSFAAISKRMISPDAIRSLMQQIGIIMPESVRTFISGQLDTVLDTGPEEVSVTLKAITGIVISFWAATAGVRAMMIAVTLAYREHEERSIFRFYFTAFMLTLAAIFIGLCSILAFVAVPILFSVIPMSDGKEAIIRFARWPVIITAVAIGLSITYRYGPSRRHAKAKWVSTGAVAATLLWIAGSFAFSTYVETVADYEAVYGTLTSIVVLLLWFWFSAVVTLMGAELNAEVEHQTCVDTTVGRDRPMGQRGAYVADHVAKAPERFFD